MKHTLMLPQTTKDADLFPMIVEPTATETTTGVRLNERLGALVRAIEATPLYDIEVSEPTSFANYYRIVVYRRSSERPALAIAVSVRGGVGYAGKNGGAGTRLRSYDAIYQHLFGRGEGPVK